MSRPRPEPIPLPAPWQGQAAKPRSHPPPPAAFTRQERALIDRLDTPERVQAWLNGLPYNWERRGKTFRTLRGVVRHGNAHCAEAVLAAATILEIHGYPPVLMDLDSKDGLGHVVLLFRREGRYGAVARSRDPGLHGRKPMYKTLRQLVQGYAAPYIDHTGDVTAYGLLDLRTLGGVDWRRSDRNVWEVERALIRNRHRPFRVSRAYYARWHARYRRWMVEHPHEKPTYYRNRHLWLGP